MDLGYTQPKGNMQMDIFAIKLDIMNVCCALNKINSMKDCSVQFHILHLTFCNGHFILTLLQIINFPKLITYLHFHLDIHGCYEPDKVHVHAI